MQNIARNSWQGTCLLRGRESRELRPRTPGGAMGARTLFTGTAAIAAISIMLPAAAPAQGPRAGVVTTLRGTATVARTTATEPAPLKFKDDVFVRDRITTGDESVARILLGGKAVVTIRERSQLTIT